MKHLSKIVFFFLYVTTALSFISCEKENNKETSIPFWRIYNKISLIEYQQLHNLSTPAIIKEAGYKQHDIYVIRWDNKYLQAFDATCTNHSNDFSHETSYTKGDLFYICNDCGTKFDIMNGIASKELNPNKSSNIKIKRLQNYSCRFTDKNTILISNYR
ncbi:MAG: hypothetical protein WBG43_08245 [Marinifilaceae bacterium]